MTIEYYEPIMDEIEKKKYTPFVGYINPRGQLIDYTTLIGNQTHYSTKNPASMMFLQFISYVMKGFSPEELKFFWDEDGHIYKNNKTEGFNDVIKRGFDYYNTSNHCSYDVFLQEVNKYYEARQRIIRDYINSPNYSLWDMHVYENLQNDLMSFFFNAYKNKNFFDSIGMTPQVDCYDDYIENHEKEIQEKRKLYTLLRNRSDRDFYNDYQIAQLMSYFKDIMVMYMGYDSIERRLKLTSNKSTEFKTITASCTNPNERYYNWLLMDWTVQRIPKMLWNEQEKRYVCENPVTSYYQTEKEEILGMEIASIRKRVPKQYRKEYFRK